jgi:endonuclease G
MYPPASGLRRTPARFRLIAVLLAVSLLAISFPQGLINFTPSAEAASPDVVISQVYGGGGNSGAAIKHDFVELFNRGTTAVNLAGWSVQYASAAGTSWQVTALGGTIAPGRYYLVQQAAGTGGTALSAPDATGSIAMSATAGKVAVVNSSAALTGACPAAVDLVGFGGASCSEGAPTPALTNTTAALRAGGGCTDTDANSADFAVGASSPRNGATPARACGVANNPPTVDTPPSPAATVDQDAATFNLGLTGGDDGGVYNWGATAGGGVASVVVNAGQGTPNVIYAVTLRPDFSGTATFTASLSDGVNPAATRAVNIAVTPLVANAAPFIHAPASPLATVAQDAAPFGASLTGSDDNNVYVWSAVPGAGVSAVSVSAGQGTSAATFAVTLAPGFSGNASFGAVLSDNVTPQVTQAVNVVVTPAPPPPLDHVVISQVYGGGGNSGATFRNDFVELYNPTTGPVDLGGWTIQYGSATGTAWQAQPLGGVMQPGEYYLISLASGGAVGAALPDAANVSGELNLSGTSGKVALSSGGDPLSGCPVGDPALVDLVGYGTTANCREGAANAPAPNNTTAVFRKNGGFADTNVNGADFATGTPAPRRTTPVTELAPSVLSSDPRAGGFNVPRDASITVNFTEPVTVGDGWFNISCAATGAHDSATVAPGGPNAWIITPNVNFQPGEQCSVNVVREFVRDADADDAGASSDVLTRNYSAAFTVADGAAPAYTPDVHLALGNPSGASADAAGSPDNYLMVKPEFALSYNRGRGTPNWVSWHLADEWVGTLARFDTFRPDPAVPADWYRVTHVDYTNSGFDRGHMTPNADRDPETSSPVNQATFLMTNMLPQAPDNNQGPWANMENYLRTLLPANELYIVAGGAGTGGTGTGGFAETIAGGRVSVPASTWKVALVIPKGDDDVSRVGCGARTIAVIMPNVQGIRNADWQGYITTVDAVETLTGYDFFSNLPDAVEACVEAGTNGVNPPGAEDSAFTTAEDAPANVTMTALPSGPGALNALTYTVVSGPTHGTLSGEGAGRIYTPAADYHGADSFTFRVADGTRASRTATVSLLVTEVNDAPTLAGVPASSNAPELAPYTFTARAGDVDGQTLTFSLVGAPAGAAIDQTGVFTWTPTEGQGGTGSPFVFTVRVSDGVADTDSAVTLTAGEVNQAPTLAPVGDSVVTLGGTLSFTASGADADLPGQGLSYSLTGGAPAGASINALSGEFSWTPTVAQAGRVYAFGVRVTDGGGLFSEQTVNVGVGHAWSGFLQPVNTDGSSVFKLGRTVPVKFQLTGASADVKDAAARLYVSKVDDGVNGTEEEADSTSNATAGNLFRYSDGHYVFNLSTKGLTAGTYQLRVDMGDGVRRVVNVSLR